MKNAVRCPGTEPTILLNLSVTYSTVMNAFEQASTQGRPGRADPAARTAVRAAYQVRRGPRARGFTMIELMIVVAIVGVLSTFAIRIYEGAVMRAHIADALHLISPMKLIIYDNLALDPSRDACQGISSITRPTNSVLSAQCNDDRVKATVTVEMDEQAGGLKLDFVSDRTSASQWRCVAHADFLDFKYLPGACR